MVIFPLNKNKRPAIPKGTSWQEYEGEANTPLIGVMVPKGVFIIDIDTYKGVSTSDIDNVLGVNLDWDSAELQSTVNGGMHYAFSVPDDSNMTNDTDVLGVYGFDTRASGKGYIATGEGYENLTFADDIIQALSEPLPELPLSVISQLSADKTEDDDDLIALISSEPLDISEDDIDHYLSLLNESHSEDRSTWLKVGMAIYHQFGDDGWPIFDKFSKLAPKEKYNKTANRRTWDSFKTKRVSNPVTFASIINLVGGVKAKSHAVVSRLDDNIETIDDINNQLKKLANCKLDNLQLESALKKISAKYKSLTGSAPTLTALKKELKRLREYQQDGNFVDDYVFLTGLGDYMHRETKTTMGVRAFNVKHNRDTPPNGEGEKQTASTFSDNIIECVHGAMYVPAFGDVFSHGGVDYFNSYTPNEICGSSIDSLNIVDRIKAHIAHLLPNKDEQELVINYLAHNVQFPGVKIQWAMLLQGVQGDGKSLLAEMIQLVLGINNVRVMNPQTLESSFTGWAVGQCMTFIEELKIDNYRKYEVINNIKPYITNSTIEVTKKGQDPQVCINTTNYFALTNFKDAIPIDDNDRRYCILFSQWQRKDKLVEWMDKNEGYYPNLYEDMRGNIRPVYDWLMNHKIPKSFTDMKRAPITSAKTAMIDLSKSEAYLIVEDALNEFECDQINEEVVNLTLLQTKVDDDFSDYKNFPKTSALKNVLLDMGYHNVGRYKNSERKNQSIYAKDDTKKAIDFSDIMNDCPF